MRLHDRNIDLPKRCLIYSVISKKRYHFYFCKLVNLGQFFVAHLHAMHMRDSAVSGVSVHLLVTRLNQS